MVPMTAAYAAEIVTWRYPPPHDIYDMSDDDAVRTSAHSGFFALIGQHELIGFRSSGADGPVPGGGIYDSATLDTGGGLRPDLTGKGLGRAAIRTGLAGLGQHPSSVQTVTSAPRGAAARPSGAADAPMTAPGPARPGSLPHQAGPPGQGAA